MALSGNEECCTGSHVMLLGNYAPRAVFSVIMGNGGERTHDGAG
jgi:hypothetical protein